jgi:hypothetical protein
VILIGLLIAGPLLAQTHMAFLAAVVIFAVVSTSSAALVQRRR